MLRSAFPKLIRWHVWLGWLIGVPLILWTASGLFMAARPIEDVRGESLKTKPSAISPINAVPPELGGPAVQKLTLEQRGGTAVWTIEYRDGKRARADSLTGELLPSLSETEARALADEYYAGKAAIRSVRQLSAAQAPMELRKDRPSWQVEFTDNTRLFIDADSGALLALRTRWWRIYDFLWGVHIMDLQTREDANNPALIAFAAVSFFSLCLSLWLLFARSIRNRNADQPVSGE
jgi:hypothetical protein